MNNVDKYYWIIDHPRLTSKYVYQASIELTPHMVNPLTNCIDLKNTRLNTKQRWWVEVSSANQDYDGTADDVMDLRYCHDWELDTGGDTAEEAIDNLYELVIKVYGKY